ncbi:hypothetical protein NH340_JMT03828 [Sarcoptes scabiei]|nr:hypothetical protein NH340_JMT03828 [Sarcoptes scabiei]
MYFLRKIQILKYDTIWKSAIGALAYLLTQTSKMIIIAGVFNVSTPLWEHLIDCVGMYYFLVYHQKASVVPVKILSIALGWTVAESVFTRFINLYLNARSLQFDWTSLISAIEANISLIQNICICALLWYWNRKSNKLYLVNIGAYFLFISFLQLNILHRIGALLVFSLITKIILRYDLHNLY